VLPIFNEQLVIHLIWDWPLAVTGLHQWAPETGMQPVTCV
jgi:hypothetical protein